MYQKNNQRCTEAIISEKNPLDFVILANHWREINFRRKARVKLTAYKGLQNSGEFKLVKKLLFQIVHMKIKKWSSSLKTYMVEKKYSGFKEKERQNSL